MDGYGTLFRYSIQVISIHHDVMYMYGIQGGLDALAGIMQSLGVNFLQNGSLVILLFQSAIPVCSRCTIYHHIIIPYVVC